MSLEPIQFRSEVDFQKRAYFGDKPYVYTTAYTLGASLSDTFKITPPVNLENCIRIEPSLEFTNSSLEKDPTITALFLPSENKVEITIARETTVGITITGYTLIFYCNSTTIDKDTINTHTITAEEVTSPTINAEEVTSPIINAEEITHPDGSIIQANVKQANDYNENEGTIKEAFDDILQSSIKGGTRDSKGTLDDNRFVLKWYYPNVTTPIIACVCGQIEGNLNSAQAATCSVCIVSPIKPKPITGILIPPAIPLTFGNEECEAFLLHEDNYLKLMIYKAGKYGSEAQDRVQFTNSQAETSMTVTFLFK